MEMVACPRCGSQFDVSAFAPGAAFTCGACGNVLQVPARAAPPAAPAAAAAPSPPAVPVAAPASPPRKSPDRRRAEGGETGGRKGGRAERIRRMRDDGGGGKRKNPLPLVGALAAAVGLAVFGVVKFAGGKPPPESPEETASTGGKETAPAPADGGGTGAKETDAEADFDSLPRDRRLAMIESRIAAARKGREEARAAVEWLEGRGLKDEAARALAAAREKFPADPWINERLGLADRSADIRRLSQDDEILFLPASPEQERLLALGERLSGDAAAGWLDAEAAARLDADVAALKAQAELLRDPVAARTQKEYSNLKLSPAFTGVDFAFKSARPYVVFVETPSPERRAAAEAKVEEFARGLQGVYGAFLKFMKEDLGMDAPRAEDLDDSRFKVFIFKDRPSFDAWHNRTKQEIPQFAGAYYQAGGDRMIMMHGDQEGVDTLMHEATHQLMHFYARHFCQVDDDAYAVKNGEPKEEVGWSDPRIHSKFFWFQEGIAEYFGNSTRNGDGTWTPGAVDRMHLAFFRGARASNFAWSVEEFIFEDQPSLRARGRTRGGGLGADAFNSLAYSQGWLLLHYLLHGEEGKWRGKAVEFIRSELTGRSGPQFLTRAFGLGNRTADDKVKAWMAELEKGYLPYAEKLMAK